MYNEYETRFYLIDPIMRGKGYDAHWKFKMERPATVEPVGDKGRRKKSGTGRVDYLLCVQAEGMPKPLPVGVIEAKAETADVMRGMEQAKGYAECKRLHVQYVFATNGHLYAEFNKTTGLIHDARPLPNFPTHQELTARYARDTGIDVSQTSAKLLFMEDCAAYGSKPRYYQDAAIRAAFEKILKCEHNREPARVLLSLATGAGKTIIATNLLWRLFKAGRLTKPALFLCDRDELRTQAYDKLKNAFGGNVRTVETVQGENAAKNARVHIATYQTLGLDDGETGSDSFLTRHYGENAFSVILIDECHRSAWGRWSEVLKRNPGAIQIGLTATPRQLKTGKGHSEEDARILADNLKYFGEPVYEYTLIQAQEDGWLAACRVESRKSTVEERIFRQQEVLSAKATNLRTGQRVNQEEVADEYKKGSFDSRLFLPERMDAMCADLFTQLYDNGGPEQKVIIFCASDPHADRIAQRMNNLYVQWCREQGKTPKDDYAFKCTDKGGSDKIGLLKGSSERCFIACTVDLLATGVDVERLNAVVFFRYLQSSILFYQMVGRGTRIHEETRKYMFWLYDYTGVSDLFGTEFITPLPPKTKPKPPGGDDDEDGGISEPPILIEMKTGKVEVVAQGQFIVVQRDGRDFKLPLEEYRAQMIERVIREAGNLTDFRELWVEQTRRQRLIDHLVGDQYSPQVVRQLAHMEDCDDFDVFAHYAYRATPLARIARRDLYLSRNREWLDSMDKNAAVVLRTMGQQFGEAGTEALESTYLWDIPEIQRIGCLTAWMRASSNPVGLFHEAKRRIFGA